MAKIIDESIPVDSPKKTKVQRTKTAKKPSKRYTSIAKKLEKKPYDLNEAITLILKSASAKFDETLEAHFRLGIDPKITAQQIRGSVKLPHSTGKKIRVLVFAEGKIAQEAASLGATVATDEIMAQIEKGHAPYDLVISTPEMMTKIARLARSLGVRGLMPNPKNVTVTADVAAVIKDRSEGLIDFKNDQQLIHTGFGKASFPANTVRDNFFALYQAVVAARPTKTSGEYIKGVTLTSTMSPGLRIDIESIKN